MAARVVYTQKGSDPSTLLWLGIYPVMTGTPLVIRDLIAYPGTGMITFPDGRQTQQVTSQGSTLVHVPG